MNRITFRDIVEIATELPDKVQKLASALSHPAAHASTDPNQPSHRHSMIQRGRSMAHSLRESLHLSRSQKQPTQPAHNSYPQTNQWPHQNPGNRPYQPQYTAPVYPQTPQTPPAVPRRRPVPTRRAAESYAPPQHVNQIRQRPVPPIPDARANSTLDAQEELELNEAIRLSMEAQYMPSSVSTPRSPSLASVFTPSITPSSASMTSVESAEEIEEREMRQALAASGPYSGPLPPGIPHFYEQDFAAIDAKLLGVSAYNICGPLSLAHMTSQPVNHELMQRLYDIGMTDLQNRGWTGQRAQKELYNGAHFEHLTAAMREFNMPHTTMAMPAGDVHGAEKIRAFLNAPSCKGVTYGYVRNAADSVANQSFHYAALRKVDGAWWSLDSRAASPEMVTDPVAMLAKHAAAMSHEANFELISVNR